jgi:hypothetical protein
VHLIASKLGLNILLRLLQCFGFTLLSWLVVAIAALPASAATCDEVIYKGCLLDSLAQINSKATNVDDENSNDYIIRLNATLILSLLGGHPAAGITLLNKMADAPMRDYLSTAAVRALEDDGHEAAANALLSRIVNPADHASAQAYRALVNADYVSALNPALIAMRYGEIGPIIGVIELTPPTQSKTPCEEEAGLSRRCLAHFIRQAVEDENDASVSGLGNALASAIEGKSIIVVRIIRSFSDPEIQAVVALGAQRAFAVTGRAELADGLVKYTGGTDPIYALDKAIWENDMPAAFTAMKVAIQKGSLHAFLDVYQDAPAFPQEALPN